MFTIIQLLSSDLLTEKYFVVYLARLVFASPDPRRLPLRAAQNILDLQQQRPVSLNQPHVVAVD